MPSTTTIAAANGSKTTVRSKAAVHQCPTKLFIGGITKNTSTEVLRQHFCRFGRVLDCVAMRREDGQSRGFGYVTLDSAEAAEYCLAAPQVIDGRVVDLKRAVPEGNTEMALKATRLHTRGRGGAKQQQRASILSTPAPYPDPAAAAFDILSTASPMLTMMWPGAPAPLQSHRGSTEAMESSENIADCTTLLSTSSPTWSDAVGRTGLLSTAPSSPTGQWQPESLPETPTNASGGVLSANAPEFIPKADSADDSKPAAESSQKSPVLERSALGDITNTQHSEASLKLSEQDIAVAKKVEPPPGLGLMQQADMSLEPASIPWQPDEEISPTSQACTPNSLLSPLQWSTLLSTTPVACIAVQAQKTVIEMLVAVQETRTISTQTEDVEEKEGGAGMRTAAEVSPISREEFLGLRPRRNGCNLGIRTMVR